MHLRRRAMSAMGSLVLMLTLIPVSALVAGTPAAQAATVTAVPRPDHVVMLIMENHSSANILGNADAPYINSLAASGANMTSSFAITHPSQPNYIALFSGALNGVTDNSCPNTLTANNLGAQLAAAGRTFVGYSEDLPSVGYTGCTSGNYARKHNPWVNFTNVPSAANRPLTSFPTDYATLPDVSIVVPNLQHDMHDGSIAQGDTWVHDTLDGYAQWAKTHNSLLVLTFDEDDNQLNNQIPTILVGQQVQPGAYAERIDHYTVLRTLQDAFGLAPIANSASATPLLDIWKSDTPTAVFAADDFARTVTGGMGSADVGGAWVLAGSAANFSVSGGAASLVHTKAGAGLAVQLPSVRSSDTDLRMTVATSPLPGGNGLYLTFVGRRVAANVEYQSVARVLPNGTVTVKLTALTGTSTAVVLRSEVLAAGVTVSAGSPLKSRVMVTGVNPTTISSKVWSGATEPAGWQLTATDSTPALQAAGSIGLTTYLSSGGTVLPVTAKLSALSARTTVTPPTTTVLASDDFGRTLASGWGSADAGGAWTSASSASLFAVSGGSGSIIMKTAGSGPSIALNSVSSDDVDLQLTLALDKAPTGGGTYLSLAGRRVAGVGEYRGKVHVLAGGAVRVALTFVSTANVETAIVGETTVPGLTVAAGDLTQLRLQVSASMPTTLRAKAWRSGATQPGGWLVSTTDARTGMQTPGSIGLSTYVSSSSTNAPVVARISQLRAVKASTLP